MARRKTRHSLWSSNPYELDEHKAAEAETQVAHTPDPPTFAEWVVQEHKPKDQNSLKEYNKLYGIVQ